MLLFLASNLSFFHLSFAWSVLAKLHWCDDRKHANRVSKYRRFRHELLDCQAPMPIDGIDAFEVSNNLAVNVYELGGDQGIYPLRSSTLEGARDVIDLLFIEEDENQHYRSSKAIKAH